MDPSISRSRVDKVDKKCYSINRKVSLYDLIVNRKVSYFLHMENVPHYVIQAPLYFYTVVLFIYFNLNTHELMNVQVGHLNNRKEV